MNTITISLPNLEPNDNYTFQTQELEDVSLLNIKINEIYNEYPPLYIRLNWGDGETETFQSNINKDYRVDDITQEVLHGIIPSIFTKIFSHKYIPNKEPNSIRNVDVSIEIKYPNNNTNNFTIPIAIRTYDYNEIVGDIKLKNTNILDNGDKEHQFVTEHSGQLFEIKTTIK